VLGWNDFCNYQFIKVTGMEEAILPSNKNQAFLGVRPLLCQENLTVWAMYKEGKTNLNTKMAAKVKSVMAQYPDLTWFSTSVSPLCYNKILVQCICHIYS